MVDLQRGLARDTGEAASVIDLADAFGIFARVAGALGRPDLIRVALTEQYSLAQMFQGPRAQEQLERITASRTELHQAAPDVPVVVPGPGAWRMRGSYLDLLAQPAPSSGAIGGFAARLAAESRLTDPAPGSRPPVDPSVIADCATRLDRAIALADTDQIAEADRVLAELADELGLHDGATSGPARRDVRRLWSAALYERAMLRHRLGHSDDAWDLTWLSVVVAVRRHEGLVRATAAGQQALADAATHMVDAASWRPPPDAPGPDHAAIRGDRSLRRRGRPTAAANPWHGTAQPCRRAARTPGDRRAPSRSIPRGTGQQA